MASHSLDAYNKADSYTLSCEVVNRGLNVVIFDNLTNKGVDAEQAKKVIDVATNALDSIGLVVEIE